MRIIIAVHHFPPKYTAGAEQYAYRVAQGLRRQGHAIEVVCIESITEGTLAPMCEIDTYDDLLVHRLHFDIRQAPDPFVWSFRNPELGAWVGRLLDQKRPDIVHINGGYLLGGTVPEASHALGIPTVLTLHDYSFLCPQITLLRQDGRICQEQVPASRCVWCSISEKRCYRLPDRQLHGRLGDSFVRLTRSPNIAKMMGLTRRLETMAERRSYLKQVLETIDLVISPSRFLLQKVKDYGFKPRKMVYLPFGTENIRVRNHPPHNPSDKLRVGYLGQFAPHKGVHLLLAAFQRLAAKHPGSCELVLHGRISGDSPYERELLEIAGNDPAIKFAGPYPNSEVGRVLSNLDVIVVPSNWYENRPTVIIEALATQTPVVAARLGGMAELVNHEGNGLLFKPGDADSLAQQLQRLLDEPQLLPALRSGIGPVKSVGQEIDELEAIYRCVLTEQHQLEQADELPKAYAENQEARVHTAQVGGGTSA